MTITIANTKFDKWQHMNVCLIYDSVASTFSFSLYFDPNNAAQRKALQPGIFPDVVIEHNGQTLITGTLLNYRFRSSANKHLVFVSGYSKTGILQDCQFPDSLQSFQFNGLSFEQFAQTVCNSFGLTLTISDVAKEDCGKSIAQTSFNHDQTAAEMLFAYGKQLNVVVSHTPQGGLLLTKYKTKDNTNAPVFGSNRLGLPEITGNRVVQTDTASAMNFKGGEPGIEYEMMFDGQRMHSTITAWGQSSIATSADTNGKVTNPYVATRFNIPVAAPIGRPRQTTQSIGDGTTIAKVARNLLSEEFKALPLTITMRGWREGKVRAGDIITVVNPELHIYNPTRFFVEQVDYKGDEVTEVATLTCVIPETFNDDVAVNIFA